MGSIQKQEVASRVMSVGPLRKALVRAEASFSIRHFSGLLSVCATPRVRVMGGSPTFDVARRSGGHLGPCAAQAGRVQRVPTL